MPGAYGPQLIPGQPPSFPSGQPTLNPGPTAAPPVNELPAPTTEARAQTPRNNRLVEHGLAVKAMRQGRFAEADVHFLRAWDQGPPTAELLNDMGYRLYLERRFAEAESVYRQALFIEPHHVAATLNLGRVLARQGRIDESLAVFRQVNGEAEAEANVAYVLADYGSVETAVAHYGRSGEISVAMRSRAQNSVSVIARLPSSSPSDFPLGPQQDTTPVGGVAGAGGAMPPVTARITKVRPAVE
jgi:predicted Zn-dependent protease